MENLLLFLERNELYNWQCLINNPERKVLFLAWSMYKKVTKVWFDLNARLTIIGYFESNISKKIQH